MPAEARSRTIRASQLPGTPWPLSQNDNAAQTPEQRRQHTWRVLLLWPNIIGYVRLLLVVAAWALAAHRTAPLWTLGLYLSSLALDSVDGVVARRLNQASALGAWLDVWVDNLSRGSLWVLASGPGCWGLAVCMLEMTTFLATHSAGGAGWKEGGVFSGAPAWVSWLMSGNFRTPQGAFMMLGLMGCPLWLWARSAMPTLMSPALWATLGCVLALGRAVAAVVELWVLQRYLGGLCR